MEQFKDIEGYEGKYQISNYGNVKSLPRKGRCNAKILKTRANNNGYLLVDLHRYGEKQTLTVHRLVAEAFIPNHNPSKYDCLNHKDENKQNNMAENIEWCTCKYNCNYGTRNERITEALSRPVEQYDLKGNLIKVWSSTAEAGRNGFQQGHVTECCNGKRKTHKHYIWQYS